MEDAVRERARAQLSLAFFQTRGRENEIRPNQKNCRIIIIIKKKEAHTDTQLYPLRVRLCEDD